MLSVANLFTTLLRSSTMHSYTVLLLMLNLAFLLGQDGYKSMTTDVYPRENCCDLFRISCVASTFKDITS